MPRHRSHLQSRGMIFRSSITDHQLADAIAENIGDDRDFLEFGQNVTIPDVTEILASRSIQIFTQESYRAICQ